MVGICPERTSLQQEFAEAVSEFTSSLDARILSVMAQNDITIPEERVTQAANRRRKAMAAILTHTREHGEHGC